MFPFLSTATERGAVGSSVSLITIKGASGNLAAWLGGGVADWPASAAGAEVVVVAALVGCAAGTGVLVMVGALGAATASYGALSNWARRRSSSGPGGMLASRPACNSVPSDCAIVGVSLSVCTTLVGLRNRAG